MKVAIMITKGNIIIKDAEKPIISANDVLIKIKYVGICGSDLHYFENGKIGSYEVSYPFILGHECSGIVEEVGENVKNLNIGDNVAIEPGEPCGDCNYCKEGRYNLCPDVKFLATPPFDGCLCEYMIHPSSLVFKLPKTLSLEHGALLEPFAIGVYSTNNAVKNGDKVLISGAGCIGLVTLLAAIAKGASKVYVTDIHDKRLEKALKLGAIPVNVSSNGKTDVPEGIDTFIECSGSHQALHYGLTKLKKGGTGVLVGLYPSETVPVNVDLIIDKEIKLISTFRYANIYPQAIEAMEILKSKDLDIAEIITNKFNFEDVQKAFEEVSQNKKDIVKALIEINMT